ncbi:MAG: Zn-ribbon domain-containing OB-fold protein [Dehalococcoidia bacterium]
MAEQQPVAEGMFVPVGSDGQAHLLISRCSCGAIAFPPRKRCAACGIPIETIEQAPTNGVIHTWTTQPGTQPPRVVALVKLDGGLTVQGFVDAPVDAVSIDQRVRTVAVPFDRAAESGALSYAFEVIS